LDITPSSPRRYFARAKDAIRLPVMSALAYLIPPVTGLFAYLKGSSPRVRLHGLQSVALGILWPSALYVGSWISPTATRVAFVVFTAIWVGLIVATAFGFDPVVPGSKRALSRATATPPWEGAPPESGTSGEAHPAGRRR
jgi:uncharacterized membrane protein